jgi:hypothetical protein
VSSRGDGVPGDSILAEVLNGGADGHDAVEFVGGIGAVVPEVRGGRRRGAGVFVGDEDEAAFLRFEDGVEAVGS